MPGECAGTGYISAGATPRHRPPIYPHAMWSSWGRAGLPKSHPQSSVCTRGAMPAGTIPSPPDPIYMKMQYFQPAQSHTHPPPPPRPNLTKNAIFSVSTVWLQSQRTRPTSCPGLGGGSHHPLPKKKKAPLGKCEPSIILTCAPQRLSSVPLHLCTAGFAFH